MRNLIRRPVVVVMLVAVLGIAACTVPTETEVDMGQRLTYTYTPGTGEVAIGMLDAVKGVTSMLEAQPGIDDVSVSVSEVDGGPVELDLMVWGRGISVTDLTRRLHERWPVLADAHLESESLSSSVRTNLGQKLGHNLFHIDVLEGTEEEMRDQILQQIYESGFEGEAIVDVHQDGDLTTIGLEMIHEGDGIQTEDELVIEIKEE